MRPVRSGKGLACNTEIAGGAGDAGCIPWWRPHRGGACCAAV